MKHSYWTRFFKDVKGGYSVDIPDLPGCITWGKNVEEAYAFLITQAIPLWLEEQTWPEARPADEILALPTGIRSTEMLLVRVSIGDVGGPVVDTYSLWSTQGRDIKRKSAPHYPQGFLPIGMGAGLPGPTPVVITLMFVITQAEAGIRWEEETRTLSNHL